ncbi:MAG: hypothetical protein HUJ79_07270, partial [Firmicutes bacterium]|nr:hypothetical protein [Bacillota bacterium]
MGIKRYKNAIREIRANGNYLKLLKKPVSAGTVLVLTGRGQEEEDRKSALLNCLEARGISGKIKFASGNKINREILSTAGTIITDDALPDYFIKKDKQNLIMLCDTLMERRK